MHNAPDYALYERIYQVIAQVPAGKVSTYGDIAAIIGGGCDARTVGYALREVPDDRADSVPWQRIINKEGGISTRGLRQRQMLEAEGIEFDQQDHAIMARFRWDGPTPEWAAAHNFNTLPPHNAGEQMSMF